MAMVEPVASAAVKHEVKKKAKKTVEQHVREKAVKRAQTRRAVNTAKNTVRKTRDRAQTFTGAHRIKSPHSYNVRRSHNLLIAAWVAGTVIISSALWNNNKESPQAVWKRMFAYQAAMIVLSWLSLIESLTGWAAMFGWLVTAAVALNEQENIVQTIARFGGGLSAPTPPYVGNNGNVKLDSYKQQYDSIIPRNNSASVQNTNTSEPAPTNNGPIFT